MQILNLPSSKSFSSLVTLTSLQALAALVIITFTRLFLLQEKLKVVTRLDCDVILL